MKYLLLTISLLYAVQAYAIEEVYLSPAEFIAQSFDHPAQQKTLWLSGDVKNDVKNILGHDYHKLRIRYWSRNGRNAWILEEIGKQHYITAGFVIADDTVERVSVLIFRESRGWEIKHDFFTQQFVDAKLTMKHKLDKRIDNITGATLSVNAMKRLAQMALLLNHYSLTKNEQTPSS